jgi:hypothetical protein
MTRFPDQALNTSRRLVAALSCLLALLLTPATFAAHEDVNFSDRELDQMLAPIALYPDTLLSQVLIASTYPLEVIQADRWVRSNADLKTEDALKFAQNKDWDPSVKSLVAFPDLLKRMSDDTDWTQRLGDAFLSDEEAVMDSVQRLRKKAKAAGNLSKSQYTRIEEDGDEIVIEPAQERVVYVPVYDTRVIYGSWWYPDYPPVYWSYPSTYVYSAGFYWGPSIYVGPTYFYSSCRWRDRRVVVIDRDRYSGSRFYTGRSIVYHEGARDWHHDPVHRHGVAYYSDDQRRVYNSTRPTRYSDRVYRERMDSDRDSRWQNNDRRGTQNGQGGIDRNFHDNRSAITVNNTEDHSRMQRIKNVTPADTHPVTTPRTEQPVNLQDSPRDLTSDANSIEATNARINADRAEQLRERMERRRYDTDNRWQSNDRNDDRNDNNRVTNLGTRDSTPAFNRTPATDNYVPGQGNVDRNQAIERRAQERSNQMNERQNERATDLTPPPRQEIRQPRQEGGSRMERIKRNDDKN